MDLGRIKNNNKTLCSDSKRIRTSISDAHCPLCYAIVAESALGIVLKLIISFRRQVYSHELAGHLGIVILTDNRNLIRIIYLIPLTYMIVNLFASCPAMPQHLCRIAIPFTLLCRVILYCFNLVGFDKTFKFLSSSNNISRFSLRVILVLEERENIVKCYCFGINHISGIFYPLATTCV